MKKLVFLVLLLPLISLAQSVSIQELKVKFEEPGNAWRGKPFWSWNGDLEKDELIRQIHVMKEMGMGGFFMHSRTGLKTEYLGDKWFDLINACADEAQKLGMEAWLYDEDRWPSGLAGGLVTRFPEYRAKLLAVQSFKPGEFKSDKKYMALFSCRLEGLNCYDYRRISEKEVSKTSENKTILAFYVREKESGSFFNGYTDVDRMCRKATDYFIKITHDEYKKRCGDRLGKSIYGIFTDEPHRQAAISSFGNESDPDGKQYFIPWTGVFANEFKKRMGYDLTDKLPEIFYKPNGNAVSNVKWSYMEVAEQLFLENWVIPYHDWCEKNKIVFTGHFLHEDNLTSQAAMQGSLMRGYEYMDYPGIDVLGEENRNYWVAKQCQSVARQMGQKFILSELYGVTGWQFDFADHKYVGDWQTLFGVNLRCHHLSWYTMQGQAKRDYPASISYQSGWYTDYKYVEDYFSKVGFLRSQGQPVCDVLVINPIESVWSQIRIGWSRGLSPADPEIISLEDHYRKLFEALQGNQIDFDYGDEDIIRRHAIVTKGNGTPLFKVGKASYKTIVLGKMTTIRSSTLKLLDEFKKAGGKIILAGEAPAFVDALPSEEVKKMSQDWSRVNFEKSAIAEAVNSSFSPYTEAKDATTGKAIDDIFCQLNKDGDRWIVMALNKSRTTKYDRVTMRIKAEGVVTEWDCENNQLFKVAATNKNGYLEFTTDYTFDQSHLYTITPIPVPGAVEVPQLHMVKETNISGPFNYQLNEPNVCLLDMGNVEIEGSPKTELTEILRADQLIRDHFKLPYRSGSMIQPWFKAKFTEIPKPLGKVKIHFPFYVDEVPEKALQLCLETPNEFIVSINGKSINLSDKGWFIDKALRLVDIPSDVLKKGENVLVQEFDFRDNLNLEALYLTGNFSVRLEGNKKIIGKLPAKIATGDMTGQGFPFYSGGITFDIPVYTKPEAGEKYILYLPEYEAACVKVDPGTKNSRMIAWNPNQADITENLTQGNALKLEVVLTRRNTFGPFHFTPFTGTTGPDNFTSKGKNFTMQYILNRSGILQNPILKAFK